METWQYIQFFRFDLYQGLESLINTSKIAGSKSIIVKFEELVNEPQAQTRIICDYLEIDYDNSLIENID